MSSQFSKLATTQCFYENRAHEDKHKPNHDHDDHVILNLKTSSLAGRRLEWGGHHILHDATGD